MKFFKTLGLEYYPWTERLVKKLSQAEYRHEYVAEGVKTWVARQVRVLREQRGWSQGELGDRAEKPQSAISRLEDPDYGKLTLQTLFDLAKAYDVGLVVKFVDYPTFIRETKALDTEGMVVSSFDASQFSATGQYKFINLSATSREVLKIDSARADAALVSFRESANTLKLESGVSLQ